MDLTLEARSERIAPGEEKRDNGLGVGTGHRKIMTNRSARLTRGLLDSEFEREQQVSVW